MKKYKLTLLDLTRNLKLTPYASAPDLFLNKNSVEVITPMTDGVRNSIKIQQLEDFGIVKIERMDTDAKRRRKTEAAGESENQPFPKAGGSETEEEPKPELDEEVQ